MNTNTPPGMTLAEREEFEERAGIIEFDGGLSRRRAEFLAFSEILKKRGMQHGKNASTGNVQVHRM